MNRDWVVAQAYRLKVFESLAEGEGHEAPVLAWLEQIGYPTTTAAIAEAFTWFLAHDLGAWEGPYAIATDDGGQRRRHWLVIRNNRVYVNGAQVTELTYDNGVLTFAEARSPASDDTKYRGRITFSYGKHATLEAAIAAGDIRRTCVGRIWSTAVEPKTDNARGTSLPVRVELMKGKAVARSSHSLAGAAKLDLEKFVGRYTVTAYGKAQGATDFFVTKTSLRYGIEFAKAPLDALLQVDDHLTWSLTTSGVIAAANIRGDLAFSENEEWKTIAGELTLDGSEPTEQNFFATIVDPEWNKSTETIVGTGAAAVALTIFGILMSYYFYRNAPDVAAAYDARAKHDANPGNANDKSAWESARDFVQKQYRDLADWARSPRTIPILNEDPPTDGAQIENAIDVSEEELPAAHEDRRQKTEDAQQAVSALNDKKEAEVNLGKAAAIADQRARDNAEDAALQQQAREAHEQAGHAVDDRRNAETDVNDADGKRDAAEDKVDTHEARVELKGK